MFEETLEQHVEKVSTDSKEHQKLNEVVTSFSYYQRCHASVHSRYIYQVFVQ